MRPSLSDVSALTELVTSMHFLRDKHNIKSYCSCASKQNALNKLPVTNGVSQVPPGPKAEHPCSSQQERRSCCKA